LPTYAKKKRASSHRDVFLDHVIRARRHSLN
jgi:hypothetical protein